METYLTAINSFEIRKEFTKFRVSSHRLLIEKGRHFKPKIPLEQRLCVQCNSNEIEDEIHFLLKCSKYNKEREELMTILKSKSPLLENLNIIDQFQWIMSNTDSDIILALANYIYKAMKIKNNAIFPH